MGIGLRYIAQCWKGGLREIRSGSGGIEGFDSCRGWFLRLIVMLDGDCMEL